MKALALLLAVLALPAAAQTGRFDRFNSRTPQGRSTRGFPGDSAPFFEFAPASGAGMGTACACTTPTGAKGEALTFTRASVATCTRTASGGLATSGIADGDLVQCASGQPRVEYDGAGTLGLLVESSRQNSCLRSEALDNASWTYSFSAGKSPTVTADQAVAPDGATTAERLQVQATTGAEYSLRIQAGACPVSADTASIYIKGNGTSGTITLLSYLPVACTSCSYNPTTWTRCVAPANTITSGGTFAIGNDSVDCGGSPGAHDVFVWGAQCEAGAYATSYIPTGAAAVTRVAEAAQVAISGAPTAEGSMAASFVLLSPQADRGILGYGAATQGILQFPSADVVNLYAAGVGVVARTAALGSPYRRRAAGYWGATSGACIDGTCTAGGAATMSAPAALGLLDYYVGAWGNRSGDGIISRVCLDPNPARCR